MGVTVNHWLGGFDPLIRSQEYCTNLLVIGIKTSRTEEIVRSTNILQRI